MSTNSNSVRRFGAHQNKLSFPQVAIRFADILDKVILNKDRHCWSATCNRVAVSKLIEDLSNSEGRRDAQGSIHIQEGPPVNQSLSRFSTCSRVGYRTRNAATYFNKCTSAA